MPCEVTRASSKTTTQIVRPDIHVIFPGSDPEAYICLQNHYCVSRNSRNDLSNHCTS